MSMKPQRLHPGRNGGVAYTGCRLDLERQARRCTMANAQQGATRTAEPALYTIRKRQNALVGGAGPRGTAGVPHGVPARREGVVRRLTA